MARLLMALPLLIWQAEAKGGYSGGGYSGGSFGGGYAYSGGYYSSGGVISNRAMFATAGAFGAIVLLNAGSRRRYGVWHDESDNSNCLLASEAEMISACSNLMPNETVCHDCMACETEPCMNRINNCDDFLSTAFTECCTDECDDGGGAVIGAIVGVVVTGLICMCACAVAFKVIGKAGAAVQQAGGGDPGNGFGSATPYGANGAPYGAPGQYQVPAPVNYAGGAPGQVVQGRVVGFQNKGT